MLKSIKRVEFRPNIDTSRLACRITLDTANIDILKEALVFEGELFFTFSKNLRVKIFQLLAPIFANKAIINHIPGLL